MIAMNRITGIRSIDFKVVARGHGVVNMNGSTKLRLDGQGKPITNHQMPKLRGYTNIAGY